jgi:hypothetical protein
VYQIGLEGWAVTNVLAQGPHALSVGRAGSVQVLPNALAGFVDPGDAAWWSLKVQLLDQILVGTLLSNIMMAPSAADVHDHTELHLRYCRNSSALGEQQVETPQDGVTPHCCVVCRC